MTIAARVSALGPVHRTTFVDAVHFEWIKMRTVRASGWSLVSAAALMLGIGLIGANQVKAGADPTIMLNDIMSGVLFGQIAMCVFGAMVATGEYATGTISTTFAAVPSRPRVLCAKALVVWTVATVAGVVTSLAALFTGVAALPAGISHPSATSGPVLRAVIGLGLYLGVLAVFALALGLVLRAAAGAVTAATTITVAVPIAFMTTGSVGRHLDEWWPTEAGRHILDLNRVPGVLPPVAGFGYFVAVAAAAFAIALLKVKRSDA